jgi:hypothetical protein
MRILIFVAILAMDALCFRAGMVEERLAIKATCDSDDLPTVIDGTTYICLSPAQAAAMQRALQQRGA